MDVSFRNVNMKMAKGMCWQCCFLWLLMVNFSDASRLATKGQNLEVKKHLSRLNKTPLKFITCPDGDIIDCVHVSRQPAFDHPLLENHTIQMRPSYHPEGLGFDDSKVSIGKGDNIPITQLWHLNGTCPEGTVPIRRTKEEDVLRASSVERFGKKEPESIPNQNSAPLDVNSQRGHEHATACVKEGGYFGAKAIMNVWNPHVQQPDEFSLAQLWILGGSFASGLNTIEAGWHVIPNLYRDSHPRLFIYWTGDAYKSTGCYNLLCSGFIQTNKKIALGARIAPISSYGGPQYDISILVWKDPKTRNWWLQFGNVILGYWPESIFTYLRGSASEVHWGGEVVNKESGGMHTTTQMGSGHFPGEGFGKTSYFKNLQVVDDTNKLRDPSGLATITEKSNCYRVNLGNGGVWRKYFYYGGPGRNPDCP